MTKYRAVATVIDNIRFASKREGKRYGELKLLEKAGEIGGLILQPRYKLVVNGALICTYVGDFFYTSPAGSTVEDAKGFRTREYIIKSKLFRALYPHLKLIEV